MSTDKAEALAKLPMIEVLPLESQEAVKTGADGTIIVMPVDSFHMDVMANIKTYEDTREGVFQSGNKNTETQNPPVAQGEIYGGEGGISI